MVFARNGICYCSFFNMVVVAQLVEYQIVALRVMGSNPIFHPKKADLNTYIVNCGGETSRLWTVQLKLTPRGHTWI